MQCHRNCMLKNIRNNDNMMLLQSHTDNMVLIAVIVINLLIYGPNEVTTTSTQEGIDTYTNIRNATTRFSFKPCTSAGREGPSQYMCTSTHKTKETAEVTVIKSGPLKGVQVWIVPKNTTYSITSLGAAGGLGLKNKQPTNGAYVNAEFNLTEGEKIYILVGQPGKSACDKSEVNDKVASICRFGNYSGNNGKGKKLIGGGGGGGGGSFVFKRDNETGELIPLVIAGGGGGSSALRDVNPNPPIRGDGGISAPGPGTTAKSPVAGPGGGGGWNVSISSILYEEVYPQSGQALLEGAIGGLTCKDARQDFNWQTDGGFGGGGGGCTAGGGGGGYTGGNVSMTDDPFHNGQGGTSYIHPDGKKRNFVPGANMVERDGEVEIAFVVECQCEFICIYQDVENKEFMCYCPPNYILAEDKISCTSSDDIAKQNPVQTQTGQENSKQLIYGITAGGVVLLLIVVVFGGYCSYTRAKKRNVSVSLDALNSPDYQLDRLRHGGIGIMTEYNPNYDFGGPKCTLQDLREIPRDHLTLVRALGQGAFGEVYMGYLANVPRELRDLPVAVKTLPALCTDEAEMDFLMEALIMSKFSHPNIVRFIGVCFEKHPRYIVLELLEGGDLKTFLRESRPKPDNPSRVTMMDLVKLATDIARGCQYLEENHFIHRDIAARNCLLTTKGPERVAKIADFGMARDIYRADYYRKGGKAMLPVKWMPPEAFLDGIFTSKTDVWSFGILLWEVFSLGYMPYPGRGNQEVMQLVTAGGRMEPPQNCPTPVYHIMTVCWHGIPERRPTFSDIISKLEKSMKVWASNKANFFDPEVIHSPLPVFHRPMSVEHDVMRPKDSNCMVLTVDTPKLLEPDSPNSMDPLIGPQSPDVLHSQEQVKNACSALDSLLSVCEEANMDGTISQSNCPTGVYMYDTKYTSVDNSVANTDAEAREDSKLLMDDTNIPEGIVNASRPGSLPVTYGGSSSMRYGDSSSGTGCNTSRLGPTDGQNDSLATSDTQSQTARIETNCSSVESQEKVPVGSQISSEWAKTNPNFENPSYVECCGTLKEKPVTYENVQTGHTNEHDERAPENTSNTSLGLIRYSETGEDATSRTSSNLSEDQDRGDSGIVVEIRKKVANQAANLIHQK